MSAKKYFQTLVTIEILGNEPYEGDIAEIGIDITDGAFSGVELSRKVTETNAEVMRELLIDQGSDPSFLITEDSVDTGLVEGRAEALCNLWGDDPNDDKAWRKALAHARQEVAEGTWPEAEVPPDVYPSDIKTAEDIDRSNRPGLQEALEDSLRDVIGDTLAGPHDEYWSHLAGEVVEALVARGIEP